MTRADVVVAGTGIAGLWFALRVAERASVVVFTKKDRPESSTNYAQGGIAAVFGPDDDHSLHAEDTLIAGAGLCHRDAVEVLVREGPDRVRELIELGVRFTRDGSDLSLGREGGHSRRRIVRAADLTGREVERALLEALADHPHVEIRENHVAVDLLTVSSSRGRQRSAGVVAFDAASGELHSVHSQAVLLATGGCGHVYRHTTNPGIATGDGVAMAFRAGARIANMEFVQFHPTALYPAEDRSFLISEAVRGEGAVLVRRDGTPFMERYHLQASLAPRDIVARAIDREMKLTGDPFVYLDCSPISEAEIRARFPNIFAETRARGIDMLQSPLPVVPAAHYLCGGVLTDLSGRTSIRGLYAAGETACTGVHGANRLASNSLLEALVFSERAAIDVLRRLESDSWPDQPDTPTHAGGRDLERIRIAHDREELRALMWDLVGIVRSEERLRVAEARVSQMEAQNAEIWASSRLTPELIELRNLLQVALLVLRSARWRKESRGLHYNVDYPYRDNERYLRPTIVHRAIPEEVAA